VKGSEDACAKEGRGGEGEVVVGGKVDGWC